MKKETFRILLTEKCNANCSNCFNADYRKNKDMYIEDFFMLCDFLSVNNIKHLKIMGGEPTVHPYFLDAVEYAQKKFSKITIFTNAVNDVIKKIKIRDDDCIVYNFNLLSFDFDFEKFMLNMPGNRGIEVQISSYSDTEKIIKLLSYIFDNNYIKERIGINLTLDCTENIFDNKNDICSKWNRISDYINKDLSMEYCIDHNIPMCFIKDNNFKIKAFSHLCSTQCSGLIDCSLNLLYCNQNPVKLLDSINLNNNNTFALICDALKKENIRKANKNQKAYCKDCQMYNFKCNGGCFIHKYI